MVSPLTVACGGGDSGADASPSGSPPLSPGSHKAIAVIGAGLAGLAAASQLQAQGHDVVVFEGRDRIGGRIWTAQRWGSVALDMGATWIHGVNGNPLTDVANALGAARVSTSYDLSRTYASSGGPLSAAQEAQLESLRARVAQALKRAQGRSGDVSVLQAVQSLFSGNDAAMLRFVLSSEYEQEYAGSASQLSAQWFDDSQEFSGGDVLFAQGFQTITNGMARNLNIQTGHTVQAIDWSGSPVRLLTNRGEFTADKVVVTLPLGVLKAGGVRFTPGLPAPKQQAISSLGMGVLNKCYLRFDKAFWPNDVDWIEHVSPQPGVWTEWVSFLRATGEPVLLGFNAAQRARDIEPWSDAATVDDAMNTLRTLFGAQIPNPVGAQITRWASDPFALGSYSFNAIGSTPQMRVALSQPIDQKLFFAGEATSKDHFSTAHGAWLSGQRAAQQVGGA